jgi:hypothetical protein
MDDDNTEIVGFLSDEKHLSEIPVLIELVCKKVTELFLHFLPRVVKPVEVDVGEKACVQQQGACLCMDD